MAKNDSYFAILTDILYKKSKLLDEISVENERQYQALKGEEIDEEIFEQTVEKKQVYIDELNNLDEGFQKIYNRVKEELEQNKEAYAEEIRTMQRLIREVVDKSMTVEGQEKKNRDAFVNIVSLTRKKGRTIKTAQKVATGYYANMNRISVVDPQFMDQKK